MINKYKTHNCNELNIEHIDEKIILSGWLNSKRDHGSLLFLDLRDSTGLVQCVIDSDPNHKFELDFGGKINEEAAALIQEKCKNEESNRTETKDSNAVNPNFVASSKIRLESVVTIEGIVIKRSSEAINKKLATGEVEVKISRIKIESFSEQIPFQINDESGNYPEDLRFQ